MHSSTAELNFFFIVSDCLAKMQGKFSAAADPAVFNEMCKSNLCGSSASVAAQPVSKRKMNGKFVNAVFKF